MTQVPYITISDLLRADNKVAMCGTDWLAVCIATTSGSLPFQPCSANPRKRKGRPFIPSKGGNDCLQTPPELARAIVEHFRPSGKILEPCRGDGAFTDAMPGCDWCELKLGIDFLTFTSRGYNWLVTNPPWSLLRQFLL